LIFFFHTIWVTEWHKVYLLYLFYEVYYLNLNTFRSCINVDDYSTITPFRSIFWNLDSGLIFLKACAKTLSNLWPQQLNSSEGSVYVNKWNYVCAQEHTQKLHIHNLSCCWVISFILSACVLLLWLEGFLIFNTHSVESNYSYRHDYVGA
jgi:hypothetical protein